MVRTKADSGARKAVAAKAPRKVLGGGGSSSSSVSSPSSSKANKYAGGNSVFQRPTPEWQKGIDGFLQKGNKENAQITESVKSEEQEAQNTFDSDKEAEVLPSSSSSSSRKKARISSDEDDD